MPNKNAYRPISQQERNGIISMRLEGSSELETAEIYDVGVPQVRRTMQEYYNSEGSSPFRYFKKYPIMPDDIKNTRDALQIGDTVRMQHIGDGDGDKTSIHIVRAKVVDKSEHVFVVEHQAREKSYREAVQYIDLIQHCGDSTIAENNI